MKATMTVSNAPRGGVVQAQTEIRLQSAQMTRAWGSQPGTASVTYVSEQLASSWTGVAVGAQVLLTLGASSFYGICTSDVARDASSGSVRVLEFADQREFLKWDVVAGAFNMKEDVIVSGTRVRRYWHILPANTATHTRTYTTTPYTGQQILAYLFGASTVASTWTANHNGTLTAPAYQLDLLGGSTLDAAITTVSEACGAVFTLTGNFTLSWVRKGWSNNAVASLPGFPTENSDEHRVGATLPDRPGRVMVIGSRNRYQVTNLALSAGWNSAWQSWWEPDLFVAWVYANWGSTGYQSGARYNAVSDRMEGWFLAAARARELTVRDVANAASSYADTRMFNGLNRMDLPAFTYIRDILFRVFTLPTSLPAPGGNRARASVALQDKLLAKVEHNATTGAMSLTTSAPADGGGYVIARGYEVGVDVMRNLERVPQTQSELDTLWSKAQDLWQSVPFQVDSSGEGDRVLVFDQPMIRATNLLKMKDNNVVFRADPTFSVPPVRASLVFDAERFTYTTGTAGTRTRPVNEPGLYRELAYSINLSTGAAGSATEIPYADDQTAAQKAAVVAAAALRPGGSDLQGGYKRYLETTDTVTALAPGIDRVTVTTGPQGAWETVDLTAERQGSFTPSREYDRKVVGGHLAPGQKQLQQEAEDLRLIAATLRASPKVRRLLELSFAGPAGKPHPTTTAIVQTASGTDPNTLAAGQPLWRQPSNRMPVHPADTSTSETVFAGVTVRENENIATREVPVATQGEVPCMVKGPVAVNDPVGRSTQGAYLVANGDISVGTALEAISDSSEKCIRVRLGGGSGGSTVIPRWL